VATPLERSLSDISGISSMTSSSSLGTTSITIQFDLSRNIDAAAQDVQTAINAAGGKCRRLCRAHRPITRSTRPTSRSFHWR
jgi:multidrug efflux pump subunit AcrB